MTSLLGLNFCSRHDEFHKLCEGPRAHESHTLGVFKLHVKKVSSFLKFLIFTV